MKLRLQTFTVNEDVSGYGEPVTSPRLAGPAMLAIFAELDADVENFVILALNGKGKPLGFKVIGKGTATACLASPRDVFRAALALNASTVLVAHNHPSGELTPSREDMELTRRLRACGDSLGLPLADHLILSADGRSHSFRASERWDA